MTQLLMRAQVALDAGQTAEAAQMFRGAVASDRHDPQGHIGLARCLAMVGQAPAALERLVSTGRDLAAADRHDAAYAVLSEALRLDPSRLDLHVDLAELEIGRGDRELGVSRLHELARAYLAFGLEDEGRCILESIAAMQDPELPASGAVVVPQTGVTEPMGILLYAPRGEAREETVIARTVLRFPDGSVMPGQSAAAAAPPRPSVALKPRVRFRVPSAPRLKTPKRAST